MEMLNLTKMMSRFTLINTQRCYWRQMAEIFKVAPLSSRLLEEFALPVLQIVIKSKV